MSKIRPFKDQYNWKDINFPTGSKNWKKLETNNKTIALHVFFLPNDDKSEKIRLAYISKHHSELEHKVILVMITDGENAIILVWKTCLYYFTELRQNITARPLLSELLTIIQNLNHMWIHARQQLLQTNIVWAHRKILTFAQNHKSMKIPFAMYEHTECLLEKIHACDNKLTKSFT